MLIKSNQIRAARGLLDWTVTDLAKRVGVGPTMISALETGRSQGSIELMRNILIAFRDGGVEFTDDGGLRPVKQNVEILNGAEGLKKFMDDVYEVCAQEGGEVCVYNAKPSNWTKWLGEEWFSAHNKRMKAVKDNFDLKITTKSDEADLLASSYAEYRGIPDDLWDERSFYAYGNKIGFINFQDKSVDVFVLSQKEFTDSFRSMFKVIWNTVAIAPKPKGGR